MGAAHDGADLPHFQAQSKLLATASVNIAKSFAVQGFRIYDSKNGLFVKEPQRSYVKNGTEMTSSVFFPVTKEAGTRCTARSSTPTRWSWSSRNASTPNQRDELEELLEDDLPFEESYEVPPSPHGRGRPRDEYVTQKGTIMTHTQKENTRNATGSGAVLQRAAFFCFRG